MVMKTTQHQIYYLVDIQRNPQVVERMKTGTPTASRERMKGENTPGDIAHIPNFHCGYMQWWVKGISQQEYCRYHQGQGFPPERKT